MIVNYKFDVVVKLIGTPLTHGLLDLNIKLDDSMDVKMDLELRITNHRGYGLKSIQFWIGLRD